MKLPNRVQVEIRPEKILEYLLSPHHPMGRHKAAIFFRLGYTVENWERLASDLLALGRTGEAERVASTYGEKFRIVGNILGPNGRSVAVLTLHESDVRPAERNDLISVRRIRRSA